jgi:hypothetical protein
MSIEIVYWKGDCVTGDWDAVAFESRERAEAAGWVVDEVVNGVNKGHLVANEMHMVIYVGRFKALWYRIRRVFWPLEVRIGHLIGRSFPAAAVGR